MLIFALRLTRFPGAYPLFLLVAWSGLTTAFVYAETAAPKPAPAETDFRYPEAAHGGGTLKYINNIPVVTLEGTPAEMGEQEGVLVLKPAAPLLRRGNEIIAHYGWQGLFTIAVKSGNLLQSRFPADHLKELNAGADSAAWPRDLLVFANSILDLRGIVQCSALIVEAERSETGTPLFGRNLDWPPVANLHEYSLLVVRRPEGKRAFASITFPGIFGCFSGMNDAGLAIAMLDASSTKDGSPGFNPAGIPIVLLQRRVLEECSTVEDATALLRSVERASSLNIAMCDKNHGAVLEVTPKTVAVREPQDKISICTNHFRTAELATSTECWRYNKLASRIDARKFSITDIATRLHEVNQGQMTLQTMIFEPRTLSVHLAFGPGPASRFPLNKIELAELFHRSDVP